MTDDDLSRPRAQRRQRQPNLDGGRRSRFDVKTSPEDAARLRALAAAAGITVPRFLVEAAFADLGETATDRTEKLTEFLRARRLMAAVSNNLNQLTKAANATGEVHEDLQLTLARVRHVADQIDEALTGLNGNR